jgi:pimeloyl-ACP methyl ester carboxylesterase
MSTVVLVHPAWLGGWSWRALVTRLRAAGHDVWTPTLTGLGERAHLAHRETDLTTHIEDVAALLTFEDLRDVCLVANSSGGLVITGVADRMPERIAQLVYLDAFVPRDGQCLLDLVPAERRKAMEELVETEGDGWLLPRFAAPPWEQFLPTWEVTDPADLDWLLPRLRPTPFGHFTTPVRLTNPAADKVPRTFVRCTRWPHAGFERLADLATRSPGWRSYRLDASHLPYVTSPEEVTTLLLTLA